MKLITFTNLPTHGSGPYYSARVNFYRGNNVCREHCLQFSWGGYGWLSKSIGGCFDWLPKFTQRFGVFSISWLAGSVSYVRRA